MPAQVFSEGARIDIATNFADLGSIDFSADFQDFLDGDFRVGHLLTLIHESTHHWCLITPVGTALAARTFRTYHDAAYIALASRVGAAFPHERKAPLDASIFASRTLTSFFVPLLEGLALYAEWRASPAEGGVYSRPFDIFNLFAGGHARRAEHGEAFRGIVAETEDLSSDRIGELLQGWLESDDGRALDAELILETNLELARLRRNDSERARFRRVLQTAIDPRDGSYQLGYLFVCAVERLCDAHQKTDMLLAFLRDHFFGDLELAALVLDEELPLHQLYSEVRGRLQSKAILLATDPEAAAAALRAWEASTGFAPVTRSSVDDFFGRHPPTDADRIARVSYRSTLSKFCSSVGSEIVTAEELEDFLAGGRVLMPLGSGEYVTQASEAGRQVFRGPAGDEVSMPTSAFSATPNAGEVVKITMLVNVASPGTAVSLRWADQFEVLSLSDDQVSRTLVKQLYRRSEIIGAVVEEGQSVIGKIHRHIDGGTEPIEAFIDDHLASDAVALDIMQIYRGPIVMAFASQFPELCDSRWRNEAFKVWQPRGISTLLGDDSLLRQFLEVCGMPSVFQINLERLRASGLIETDEAMSQFVDEAFELANGITSVAHQEIVERVRHRFESRNLSLFGNTASGGWASLI